MGWLTQTAKAVVATIWHQKLFLLQVLAIPAVANAANNAVSPGRTGSRFCLLRGGKAESIDGATLTGYVPGDAYAKYTLPKGLPTNGKRVLAIENDPHQINGFDGVIPEGYGKGTKTLLLDDTVIVKIGKDSFPGRINYHVHDADVAGLHYDIVVEGVSPVPNSGKYISHAANMLADMPL